MIELNGYEPIFPNKVYGRRGRVEAQTPEGVRGIGILELVLFDVYTEPSEEEVIAYIQFKADRQKNRGRLVVPGQTVARGDTFLEKIISQFPERVLRDILTNEDCTTFLRQNTPAPPIPAGRRGDQYIRVRYGFLADELVAANQDKLERPEGYHEICSDVRVRRTGQGENWHFRLLIDNWSLPPQEELQMLTKHEVHGSKTLYVSRYPYPVDNVMQALNALLAAPDAARDFFDVTSDVLEEYAVQAVGSLAQHLQISQAMQRRNQEAMQQIPTLQDPRKIVH